MLVCDCFDVVVQGYCPDIEVAEGTVILSVTPTGNMYKSVATIGCDDGYKMDTETQTQEISCMLTGQWNAQPARCTGIMILAYGCIVIIIRETFIQRSYTRYHSALQETKQ